MSLQCVRVGVFLYIAIEGHPQTNNKINIFDTDILHACEAACKYLKYMIFLNSTMDGVICESKWVQEEICRFLRGKSQHIGLTYTNHNVKNNRYQNIGGYCAAVMGG